MYAFLKWKPHNNSKHTDKAFFFLYGCSQFVLGNWHFKYGLEEDIRQGMQIEMLKYIFYFDK